MRFSDSNQKPRAKSMAKGILNLIDEYKLDENDSFNMPYFGECSFQSFIRRMLQMYPELMHMFADKLGVEIIKIKIGEVDPKNVCQAKLGEAFVAATTEGATNLDRATRRLDPIRLLQCDRAAWNINACGYPLWGDWDRMVNWFMRHTISHGHEKVLGSSVSNALVIDFLELRHEEASEYHGGGIQKCDMTIRQLCQFMNHVRGLASIRSENHVNNWSAEERLKVVRKFQQTNMKKRIVE